VVQDNWVPAIALAGPLVCAVIEHYQGLLFGSYRLGLELLIINGALVMGGLFLISSPGRSKAVLAVN
jgi:hypothetical protein